MSIRNLRKTIRAVIKEAFDNPPLKTKVLSKEEQELEDLLNAPAGGGEVEVLPKGGDLGTRQKNVNLPPVARGGVTLDQFKGATPESILNALDSSDVDDDFDFDQAFDDALANRTKQKHKGVVGNAPEDEPGIDPPPETKQKYFPVRDLAGKKNRIQVKIAVSKVLMEEFVAPAMSVGMRILPLVWAELGRLMKSDPRAFISNFQIALNMIRATEDGWFANLLGLTPQVNYAQAQQENAPMAERIRDVLSKYYDAVLKEAARNSENLVTLLMEIENTSQSREVFEQGFFDALSETRDVEDQAFGQFLGGPAKLGMRR